MNHINCGHCLHSINCHSKHNGKFMYCSVCFSLCDIDEFNEKIKPTPLSKLVEIQLAREYSSYVPKEVRNKK